MSSTSQPPKEPQNEGASTDGSARGEPRDAATAQATSQTAAQPRPDEGRAPNSAEVPAPITSAKVDNDAPSTTAVPVARETTDASEQLTAQGQGPESAPSTPEAVTSPATSSTPSSLIGPTVASPATPIPEPPAPFVRLKAYCDTNKLKCTINTIEADFPVISIEFKNGRETRTVTILAEESAEALLRYPLAEIVFLGEFSAVCSYGGRWIEAAVRPHGPVGRGLLARRIFGKGPSRDGEPAEIEIREIPASSGLTIRLTERKGILSALEYSTPLYLRIEGIGITEHDKALNLLEDLSNSLFMQMDFRFDVPLTVARDRSLTRRLTRSRGRLDQDNQPTYPRHSYEKTPSALYWYARSATSMPLLQFLAFYQCIEFFFPQFSRIQTIAKIKNVLKDPAFDGSKDSDINVILNATLEGRRGTLLEERKQLRATLEQCVDAVALLDFLNETEQRRAYYGTHYKKISDRRITLSDSDGVVVEQTSERIYDIRCKVVHTKNLDGGEGDEMILPFSKEADLLLDDVDLIKFLARKVLVASSVPLRP
jgi:hypothetical protein